MRSPTGTSDRAPEVGPGPAEPTLAARILGFVRLSKVAVFQHYFGWALAWLLLDPSTAGRSATVSAMCAFLVGSFGIVAATCALDDIVGFRNGSDAVNYLQGDTRRDIRRKPLLSGAVTEKQAIIFVGCAAALAVLAGAYAFWQLDWRAPLLAVVLYAAGLVLSMQYSAGLRVSYHRGGGETLLFIATACGLYAPFLAVSGHWTAPAVTEGVLLGLWMVMVSSYSNVNDAEGDRGVGRRTLAATSGPTLITAVLGSLVVAALGTTVWLVIGGGFPWWTLITLGPAALLHIAQVYTGPVRKDWLGARRLGMYAYNLGFLGIGIPTLYRFVTALPPTIPSPAISR